MSSPENPTLPFKSALFASVRRKAELYAQIFNIGIQSTLVYRWNFLFRSVMGFVPLLGSLYLWGAVFEQKKEFAGYSYSLMIAYYISMILLDALTWPSDQDFQMAEDIKEGVISSVLIKPLNYLGYRLSLFGAMRCINLAVTIGPVALVIILLRHYFHEAPLAETMAPAFVAMLGSAALQFAICYCVAMLAFWILEIGSAILLVFSLEFFAGGHVFPLDLLPEPLRRILLCLPFAYEYYFPVGVLLGRVQGTALAAGFAWQGFWILFFFGLGHALWEHGLKKYTSVGG